MLVFGVTFEKQKEKEISTKLVLPSEHDILLAIAKRLCVVRARPDVRLAMFRAPIEQEDRQE